MSRSDQEAADLDKRAREAATFAEAQALSTAADNVRRRAQLSLRGLASVLPVFRN